MSCNVVHGSESGMSCEKHLRRASSRQHQLSSHGPAQQLILFASATHCNTIATQWRTLAHTHTLSLSILKMAAVRDVFELRDWVSNALEK